eukprot:scaffold145339_cov23-Cyclotella_meneghiniana.AAC.1
MADRHLLTPPRTPKLGLLPENYPTPDTRSDRVSDYLPDLSGTRCRDTRVPTRLLTQNSGIIDG